MDPEIYKIFLEMPALGILMYIFYLEKKDGASARKAETERAKALSGSMEKLAEAINRQSGVLLGLSREDTDK